MSKMETKLIKGRVFIAQITEKGLFYIKYFPNQLCVVADSIAAYQAYNELRDGQTLKIMIEVGEFTTIDKSVREYLQAHKIQAKRMAITLPSIAQRILFNFYIKFRVQDYPIKGFNTNEKALNWLDKL